MKILTKKKQEEIIAKVEEIGFLLAKDETLGNLTYDMVIGELYDIAFLSGGSEVLNILYIASCSGLNEALKEINGSEGMSMRKMRLTSEAVYKIEHDLIQEGAASVFDVNNDRDGMIELAWMEGVRDMANAVRKAINELERERA